MARKYAGEQSKLYLIVEKLRTHPKESPGNKRMYNFSDPTALRALRIHRHLRALENDILEQGHNGNGKRAINLKRDSDSDLVVISIQKEEVHCSRVAYLSPLEFYILCKNRKVANVLRKCSAWKDVA